MVFDKETVMRNWGITRLSPMQDDVCGVPSRQDTLVLSPAGSGKTVAYLLKMFGLIDSSNRALVLCPSRELVLQTADTIKDAKLRIPLTCCYGGHVFSDEESSLKGNVPLVIVATPGRLCDHIRRGNIDAAHFTMLVADEFDKIMEMGFQEEMDEIMGYFSGITTHVLTSATYSDDFRRYVDAERLAVVDYTLEGTTSNVRHFSVSFDADDKLRLLERLVGTWGGRQGIVFCNQRERVDEVCAALRRKGFHAYPYHGGMEQMQRELSLFKFASRSAQILVTTDLAARGLDIPSVDMIVHYEYPSSLETLIHRDGRSTRWQGKGESFLFMRADGKCPAWMNGFAAEPFRMEGVPSVVAKPDFVTIYIGKGKKDKISKGDILGFLCKTAELGKADVGAMVVKDKFALVAVRRDKVAQTLKLSAGQKIKGIKTVVEVAKS